MLAVETVALHLWLLSAHHPAAAWALTASSVATLAWLAADYRAMGRGAVLLGEDSLELRVGLRFTARVERRNVAAAVRPTWRDRPAPGTATAAAGYVDLMKPATPNVLLALDAPVTVRLPGGIRRSARRIALHLDDPDGFLAALATRPTSAIGG